MVTQNIRWLTAAPLWNGSVTTDSKINGTFLSPAILRFDSDAFMEDVMTMLGSVPDLLSQYVAKPETWRKPMPKPEIEAALKPQAQLMPLLQRTRNLRAARELKAVEPSSPLAFTEKPITQLEKPLKLYQPAQQRFYLLGASLVCKTAGLPDKEINAGEQEKASFVVRRCINNVEHAFVADGNGFEWQPMAAGKEKNVLDGEERIQLFNLNYRTEENKKRRMMAGLVPVAKREAYLAAGFSDDVAANPGDKTYSPLHQLFLADVAGPWKALLQQADIQKSLLDELNGPDLKERKAKAAALRTARESIQTASWYILLDFAAFLKNYLSDLWTKIVQGSPPVGRPEEKVLYDLLGELVLSSNLQQDLKKDVQYDEQGEVVEQATGTIKYVNVPGALVLDMRSALKRSYNDRQLLETVDHPYLRESVNENPDNQWPGFLFPLTDPEEPLAVIPPQEKTFDTKYVDDIVTAVVELLKGKATDMPGIEPLKIRSGNDDNEASFVIRCVYEQPACEPLRSAIVSDATEAFQMASFFDPDAPARPVRIPMPVDISPAGLRKYQKNTSLIMSDMLCGKIDKIKKVTLGDLIRSVLPWPLHKDLPDVNNSKPCKGSDGSAVGMVCSLSIPIVTLVALILMIIMVTLFDIIFRWIPYLFTCLPIPGLKGKN